MQEKPRLETHQKPTRFNRDALIGAGLGHMLLSAPALVTTLISPELALAASLAGGAIGAFIGGSFGKTRMQEEQLYGKEVHTPSFINKGLLVGLTGAYLAASYAAVGLAALAPMSPYVAAAATLMTISIVPCMVAGAIFGANHDKKAMQQEHVLAKQQHAQRVATKGAAVDPEPLHDRSDHFTKMIEAERLLEEEKEKEIQL